MEREHVPALVREVRERLDLTQEQLARRLGVTYSTVNRWENGKRAPQPFLAARLDELRAELDTRSEALVGPDVVDPTGSAPGESGVRKEVRWMVERLVERFRPEKVILFGSHARGDARPDSDVDLLVVMPVKGSRREAQLEVRRALHDIRVPKDVIVTTPEEFEWRKETVGTIERPASREGKVLHT